MGFTRTIEDFTCEKCGTRVAGNGYTNHCTSCLWSKHVDESPGDRSSLCGGAMEPIGLIVSGNEQKIVHQCLRCGFQRKQTVAVGDDNGTLIALSTKKHDA